ncbi:MAG TPA: LysR family transcriptional regulator [Kofleriaceae bacterium]|nr:LysR family transcriptional regulator [Kofleriaceae bacterium]
MAREDVSDLLAFLAVARERSFTRAAGKLGVSQSALSHTISRFEERIGMRLLTRTTRSVSPTEAGERLLKTVGPRLDEVETELAAVTAMREKPAGTIRITTSDHAANTILLPKLGRVLPAYPDVKIEIVVDYGLTDIVASRYDAGVRLGEQVARGMIAVPISPEMRMAAVASPTYFEQHARPKKPQDLTGHCCINIRLPTAGGVYVWEFERGSRELKVRVEGQLTVNGVDEQVSAALAGFGVAFVLEDAIVQHVRDGSLVRVLEEWTPPFSGYHLYYPSRRQASPAFSLVVDALRYRRS